MGEIIPASEMDIADVTALKQALLDRMFEIAMAMGVVERREELIYRPILPKTDLGLTNEYWETPSLTANTWNTYFSKQLDDQRFVGFYGVTNLSADPVVTGLKFSVGAGKTKTLDVLQIEDLYSDSERVDGYFKNPIIYKEKQYCNLEVYAKAAGSDRLVLKGFVVEPAGVVTF